MGQQVSSEGFNQAFEQVFGKDRDLSELSDIDLSDFKKVMREAVEQFDKTAPPEPEECRDLEYIFWRVYKTVHEILQKFSLDEAIKIIEERNFYDLNNKSVAIRAIKEAYDGISGMLPSVGENIILREDYIDEPGIISILTHKVLSFIVNYKYHAVSFYIKATAYLLSLHYIILPKMFFKNRPTYKSSIEKAFENFENILDNNTSINNMPLSIPLYSRKDLIVILGHVYNYWGINGEHLVLTGYSKTVLLCLKEMQSLFHKLYPIRKLVKIEYLQDGLNCDGIFAYFWKDEESPSIPEHSDDYFPEIQYFKKAYSLKQKNDLPFYFRPKYDFESAPKYDDIPYKIQLYLETKRVYVYNSFLEIIDKLYTAAALNTEDKLIEKCIDALCSELILGVEHFFILDKYYSQKATRYKRHNCIGADGGLTKLFQLMVFCSIEIFTQYMGHIRDGLKDIIEVNGLNMPTLKIDSYIGLIKTNIETKEIDEYLDLFYHKKNEEAFQDMWKGYYKIINYLLEVKFSIEDKHKLKSPYKPFLQKIRESIKARYKNEDLFPKKELPEEVPDTELEEKKTTSKRRIDLKPFYAPNGTRWENVLLTMKSETMIIRARGKRGERSYKEAGFMKYSVKEKEEPDQIWLLLKEFAKKQEIDYSKCDEKGLANLANKISILRKRLKELFPTISGDPFYFTRKPSKRSLRKLLYKHKTYTPRFKISIEEKVTFPEFVDSWDRVLISKGEDDSILFIVEEPDLSKNYLDDSEWQKEKSERLYNLNLGDRYGTPNRAGEILYEILEKKEIKYNPHDNAQIELAKELMVYFGFEKEKEERYFPFETIENKDGTLLWSPRFKVLKPQK